MLSIMGKYTDLFVRMQNAKPAVTWKDKILMH